MCLEMFKEEGGSFKTFQNIKVRLLQYSEFELLLRY